MYLTLITSIIPELVHVNEQLLNLAGLKAIKDCSE